VSGKRRIGWLLASFSSAKVDKLIMGNYCFMAKGSTFNYIRSLCSWALIS